MTTASPPVRVRVGGEAPYDVVVGTGLLSDAGLLATLLGPDARRVALLHPRALSARARELAAALDETGLAVLLVPLPEGEAAKDVDVAAGVWSQLGRSTFTRSDAIIGLGGGATTDLAGFVAATWLRGIPVVQLPTTLLGMVDAAIGGKTGINTPEGKNLVGAFHPPAGVVCDLATLASLPRRDLVSGMAEIVKAGFIADAAILDLVEHDVAAATSPQSATMREIVERAIRVKAAVVTDDLKERGGREVLNYGHTLAHAIEKVEHYSWRHGDAVSVGMVFAAELAGAAGRLDEVHVQRHRTILHSLDLPTTYQADRWPELLETMHVDKKTRGSMLRFVILDGVARPALLEDPAPEWLASAYEKVCA